MNTSSETTTPSFRRFGLAGCACAATILLLAPFRAGAQLPKLHIRPGVAGVQVSWPNSAESLVVAECPNLGAPWMPSLAPIVDDAAGRRAQPATLARAGFLRLIPGFQVQEVFGDSRDDTGWAFHGDADEVNRRFESGQYHVYGTTEWNNMGAMPNPETTADFAGSIDVLSWSDTDQSVGIMARMDWNNAFGYAGGLRFNSTVHTGPDRVWIVAFDGGIITTLIGYNWNADSEKDYRIVFRGAGTSLALDVYELDELDQPIFALTAEDDYYTSGQLGLVLANWTWESGNTSLVLDNLALTGATP